MMPFNFSPMLMGCHWHVTLCRGHTTLGRVRQGPAVVCSPHQTVPVSQPLGKQDLENLWLIIHSPATLKQQALCCEYHIQINNIGFV